MRSPRHRGLSSPSRGVIVDEIECRILKFDSVWQAWISVLTRRRGANMCVRVCHDKCADKLSLVAGGGLERVCCTSW
jgi:hypothetical protein